MIVEGSLEIFFCCLPFQGLVLAWRFLVGFPLSVERKRSIFVTNARACFGLKLNSNSFFDGSVRIFSSI